MTKDFDLEQAIKALQSGQDLTGKDGFLTLSSNKSQKLR